MKKKQNWLICSLFFMSNLFFFCPALSAQDLNSFRAFYEFETKNSFLEMMPLDATGGMVEEIFKKNKSSYSYYQRFSIQIKSADRILLEKDMRTSSLENEETKDLNFETKFYKNDIETENKRIKGQAKKITETEREIKFLLPKEKKIKIKKTVYPVEEILTLLSHAKNNETLYESYAFPIDDFESLDEPILQITAIGQKQIYHAENKSKIDTLFDKKTFWPIEITFYNDKQKRNGLPVSTVHFDLFENGIKRNILIENESIKIKAKLKAVFFEKDLKNNQKN